MYIWQQQQWPHFSFNKKQIETRLSKVLKQHDRLMLLTTTLPQELEMQSRLDAMIQNAITTSAIEGEFLNEASVRSSVAKQLGIEQASLSKAQQREQSLVEMLLSVLEKTEKPLSKKQICQWQSLLFVEPPLLRKISIGDYRTDAKGPMQVVSESRGKTLVHYEAPPAKALQKEMKAFFDFYNQQNTIHPLIKAALSHLYFISLHPFDDGNGRLARALSDRSLASFEKNNIRFYSLSAAIETNKNAYYQMLESTQACQSKAQQTSPLDVSEWVLWFLEVLEQAITNGFIAVERTLLKARFWKKHAQTILSERQVKVINRLLDAYRNEFEQGIAARHYKSIANVSKATATRDLIDLQQKGCLQALDAGGRSMRYVIASE